MSFFGFGKKNKNVEVKNTEVKPKKKLLREFEIAMDPPVKINIGRTFIKVKFSDGKLFTTSVYGYVSQNISYGQDADKYGREVSEPEVSIVFIIKSETSASETIKYFNEHMSTFLDDPKNPQSCYVGKAVHAKIIRTEDYFEDFAAAKVIPRVSK